jgi:hypothetical protein
MQLVKSSNAEVHQANVDEQSHATKKGLTVPATATCGDRERTLLRKYLRYC